MSRGKKKYSIRIAGRRNGVPHYSSECAICTKVLANGHVTKERATQLAQLHVSKEHDYSVRK